MAVEKEICPHCGGDCKLSVNLDTAITARLDDRLMALTTIRGNVVCLDCGLDREATINDFDVSLETGRLEFGDIHFND